MSIGSLAHVATAVSRVTELPLMSGELNLSKLTGDQNIICLSFVMVTRSRADGHYSYLIDSAIITHRHNGDRSKIGCFVFNKGVWDCLNAGHYKYWFAVVNGELMRIRKCSVAKLFDTLNIKLTKHNTDHLVRDVVYPDLDIQQPYLPGRPKPKPEYVSMLKATLASVRINGRQTNITIADAIRVLGGGVTLAQLEEHVRIKQREVKEFESVEEFFDPVTAERTRLEKLANAPLPEALRAYGLGEALLHEEQLADGSVVEHRTFTPHKGEPSTINGKIPEVGEPMGRHYREHLTDDPAASTVDLKPIAEVMGAVNDIALNILGTKVPEVKNLQLEMTTAAVKARRAAE